MSETFTDWLRHRAPHADPEELADALWLASLGVVATTTKSPSVAPASPSQGPPTDSTSGVKPPGTGGSTDASSSFTAPQASLRDSRSLPDSNSGSAPLVVPTDGSPVGSTSGLALRTPGGRALPGARDLLRVLRPFRRRVPARTVFVLDEERTVRNVAETDTWMPMLVPDRSRWLELALVVDESASLGIWRDSLRELRRLLEQLGAFRDVRLWRLDTSRPDQIRLQPGSGGPAVAPGQLVVTDARRVVVVVSDCTGPAWDAGVVGTALTTWGRHQPTAILQLLPASFWRRTALDPALGPAWVEIGSRSAGLANGQLKSRGWRARPGAAAPVGVPIPVFTTAPRDVANWVNLVTRATPTRVPGVTWNPSRSGVVRPKATVAGEETGERTGADRVLTFQQVASPVALDLARLLAAAPLRLPLMRLIQQVLLPGSTQVHLAEVFLGGLLRRQSPDDVTDSESVDYEFHPGVREMLLDSGDASDPLEVQRVVSDYLRERLGRTDGGFAAVLSVPGLAGGLPVPALDRAFARVQGVVLGRLGGRYREAAQQLRAMEQMWSGENPQAVRDQQSRSAAPPLASLEEGDPAGRFAGRSILWVDDHPDNNDRQVAQLVADGITVVRVKTTDHALSYLAGNSVQAVISDLGRDLETSEAGLQIISKLREHGSTIPIGLYTRRADSVREQALALGAFACETNFARLRTALLKELDDEVSPEATAEYSSLKPLLPSKPARAVRAELRQQGFKEVEVARVLADRESPLWEELTQHPLFRELGLHWMLRLLQLASGATEVGIWRRGRQGELVCELVRPHSTIPPDPDQRALLEEAFDSPIRNQFVLNSRIWGEMSQSILSLTLQSGALPDPVAAQQSHPQVGTLCVLYLLVPGNPPEAGTLQWMGRLVEIFHPHFQQLLHQTSGESTQESGTSAILENLSELWDRLGPAQQLAIALRTTRRYLATDPGESPPVA